MFQAWYGERLSQWLEQGTRYEKKETLSRNLYLGRISKKLRSYWVAKKKRDFKRSAEILLEPGHSLCWLYFIPTLNSLWFLHAWSCWVGLCLLRELKSTGSTPHWWGREAHNVIIEFQGVVTNSYLCSGQCSWSSASFAEITNISSGRSAEEIALMTDSCFMTCHP